MLNMDKKKNNQTCLPVWLSFLRARCCDWLLCVSQFITFLFPAFLVVYCLSQIKCRIGEGETYEKHCPREWLVASWLLLQARVSSSVGCRYYRVLGKRPICTDQLEEYLAMLKITAVVLRGIKYKSGVMLIPLWNYLGLSLLLQKPNKPTHQ